MNRSHQQFLLLEYPASLRLALPGLSLASSGTSMRLAYASVFCLGLLLFGCGAWANCITDHIVTTGADRDVTNSLPTLEISADCLVASSATDFALPACVSAEVAINPATARSVPLVAYRRAICSSGLVSAPLCFLFHPLCPCNRGRAECWAKMGTKHLRHRNR